MNETIDLRTKSGITPKLWAKYLLLYPHCDLNYFSCFSNILKALFAQSEWYK
jgi:hypothetical protein